MKKWSEMMFFLKRYKLNEIAAFNEAIERKELEINQQMEKLVELGLGTKEIKKESQGVNKKINELISEIAEAYKFYKRNGEEAEKEYILERIEFVEQLFEEIRKMYTKRIKKMEGEEVEEDVDRFPEEFRDGYAKLIKRSEELRIQIETSNIPVDLEEKHYYVETLKNQIEPAFKIYQEMNDNAKIKGREKIEAQIEKSLKEIEEKSKEIALQNKRIEEEKVTM